MERDGPKGNGKKIYLGSFLVAVTRNIEECILFSQECLTTNILEICV